MPATRLVTTVLLLSMASWPGGPGDAAPALAGQSPGVTWLVLVDDLHLAFPETGRTRGVLKTSLDALVRDGDRVLMRSSGPSTLRVHLAAPLGPIDRDRLMQAVKRMTGNALKPEDIAHSRREPRDRATVALAAMRDLVDSALPSDGPVALLYFTNGYVDGTMDVTAVAEQAARAGAAVFPIDPRVEPKDPKDGYWIATRGSLRELASATGGTWQDTARISPPISTRISAAVRP